jgi:hypothetical protein
VALHFGTWGRDVVGKPPVVFAADGPVTIAAFEATFVKVAESHPEFDRRVFMFEPVGQGRSRGAVGGAIECSLGQLAADVIELLRGWGHAQYVLCFSCSNALVAVEVSVSEVQDALVRVGCNHCQPSSRPRTLRVSPSFSSSFFLPFFLVPESPPHDTCSFVAHESIETCLSTAYTTSI